MASLQLHDTIDAATRVAELEREVAKLRKIQTALVGRVERSIDVQGSAFALFQTAITLEAQVRARTVDLEHSYRDAAAAREQAETARHRLETAIESFSEGFALFDAEDRLIQFNRPYLTFLPGISGDEIHVGMTFAAILQLAVAHKSVIDAYRDPEGWLGRRMQQHRDCGDPSIHALIDGRWMQISEQRTADGGIVAVYTDITNLKRMETRVREVELAKKTDLLQATLDNIFEGVAVYDEQLHLVAWNNELRRLLDLPSRVVRRGARFADFRRFNASLGTRGIIDDEFLHPNSNCPLKFEHEWPNGRFLKIERNPMPDGGFILTFADITAQIRSDEALRDGERRIRTITDAMPALISYVDADERYQFVNKAYSTSLGLAVNDIIGRRMADVWAPVLYEQRRRFIHRALGGELVEFETAITAESTVPARFAQVSFIPHIGEEGQRLGFFSLMQDVTEQRRYTAAIKEANESLERRVEHRTAALTRLNAQLQSEIAERREIETALQVAKSEAEQANLSKTKFLAAASHDLLQPLHSARLFISALGDFRQTAQNRPLIDNADASLRAVEDLLGALLDISKLDAGAFAHETVDFPVGSLLGRLSTEYMVLARERGVTLRYVPSSTVVHTDIRLLRRIVQNFLANAIRYAGTGRVLLGCRRATDGLHIEVFDTGPGIPACKLDEIFEEFKQLEPQTGRSEGGLGLGLAIAKRAAKTLGLKILTRSRMGKGSMFGVVVPYGVTPSLPSRITVSNPVATGTIDARVLVIDDQPDVLSGMAALLGGWGCIVLTASSSKEAVRIIRRASGAPQIVIADFHLGNSMTGVDAIEKVRRIVGKALPGIVITADQTGTTRDLVGGKGYRLLSKPLNPARLRSLLSATLAAEAAGA